MNEHLFKRSFQAADEPFVTRCRQVTPATALAVALLLVTVPAAGAATPIRIARVDTRGYPTLRVTVVTPHDSVTAPALVENGTAAPGVAAENLGSQESVVLAVDRSQSMRGQALAHALAASRSFLASKPNTDLISVVTFASQPVQLSDFSTSTTDADAALRSIAIDEHRGTTMYDAIVLSAGALEREGLPGRVIILITDGQETTSQATLVQAIAATRHARVAVYVIAIKDATFTPRPLSALAADTGGRMLVARPDERFNRIYNIISAELRHTWQLSYYTAARPGSQVKLTVSLPGGGTATTSVTIPGASSAKSSNGSSFSLTEIAMIVAALVVLALGAPSVLRTVRDHRPRRGWSGFD